MAAIERGLARLLKLSLRTDGHSQGKLRLRLVGRERGDALKAEERAMRINYNYFIQLPRSGKTGYNNFGADDTIRIIRDDKRVERWRSALNVVDETCLAGLTYVR